MTTIDQTARTEQAAPAVLGRAAAGLRIVGLAAGFVMSIVDTTVINVAGPRLQEQLGLSLAGLTWVVDGYTLTFASLLLLGGSLANRFGARRVFLTGIATFVTASVLAGAAPAGGVLIAARLLQGVGASLSIPSSLGLLANTFPDTRQRARIVGLWSSISAGSAAIGPMLGGVLVDTIGWRSIFFLNVPIGLIGLTLTLRLIPSMPGRRFTPALRGHALSILCLAGLCFALIEGPTYGWAAPQILAAFAVSAAAAWLFARVERRAAEPILPRVMFRVPRAAATNAMSFLLNFGLFSVIFLFGLLLQYARGASPLRAGFEMIPLWSMFVFGNIVFAKITARAGTRMPMVVTMAGAAATTLVLTSIGASTPYWVLAVFLSIGSVCIGVTVPAMTAALVDAVGKTHASSAGSTLNATRQIGTMMGVAAIGVVYSAVHSWYTAMSIAFLIAGLCYLACCLVAWRYTRPEAAPVED